MTTKKQKREAGIARREQEEKESRERGLHFLALAQAERAEERRKADKARRDRAIATSKRLARAHEAAKASKPGDHKTADKVVPQTPGRSRGRMGKTRNKKYQKSRNKAVQEA